MKRVVLLLAFILCLSGCTVDYNLTIENETFTENADVYTVNVSELDEPQEDYYDRSYRTLFSMIREMPIGIYYDDETTEYQRTLIDEDNRYGASFTHTFNISDISRSNALSKCYNPSDIRISQNNTTYTLQTTSACQMFEFEEILKEINIKIKTNHHVESNNADKVDGNTYIWTINRENYQDKLINITYDTSKEIEDTNVNSTGSKLLNWIVDNLAIVGGIIIVLTFLVVIIIIDGKRNLKKENNK